MCIPDYMGEQFQIYLEEERALAEYEEPGNDAVDRSPSTSHDKAEREVIRMEAEDYSTFDLDGVVR